ncbi:hypothetical protein EW146_g3605 [Bondarzewia mesenterica]|uniref:Enoyl reductase (ER) domain-containing protein n=1 Tax=Bondarzewia mesenterica TaxID=1095465 RepID=A0A4S4LXA7_9AGAM|nr:hypothetical protein EW146_g3605 [Bondarzewia mesenterica]
MSPSKQTAAVVGEGGTVVLKEIDVPKPGPGQILVNVVAVAQNPADWKTLLPAKRCGMVLGCDFSGLVEELGPDVPEGIRKVGERVAGFLHGGTLPNGAFSEYVTADAERVLHIPDTWSFEDAAQLGVATYTTAQCLYESHTDLPTPLEPTSTPIPLLVWGGTSSVGQYVVQFAKLSGLYVITTASPKNFDLVKALGADEVFDYNDPEVSKKIKDSTQGKLTHAVDCISAGKTPVQISDALSDAGGTVAAILVYESPRPSVKVNFSLGYELLGESYNFPRKWAPASQEDKDRGKKITLFLDSVLAAFADKIKPNPKLILPNGLASIAEGFEYMKAGKVLYFPVVRLDDHNGDLTTAIRTSRSAHRN